MLVKNIDKLTLDITRRKHQKPDPSHHDKQQIEAISTELVQAMLHVNIGSDYNLVIAKKLN